MKSFAIIPAAGQSTRMGRPKLLLPWRSTTVIEALISAWQQSRVQEVILIARPDDQRLIKQVSKKDVHLVIPDEAPADMKASVRLGLHFIQAVFSPHDEDAWLLAPADLPTLAPEIIDMLLLQHATHKTSILQPTFRQQNGHPVLFPWPLAYEVNRLTEEEGVNALTHRFATTTIPCNEASILDDLDTPADYQRLKNRR